MTLSKALPAVLPFASQERMGTCVSRYASRDANLRIRGSILPGSSGGYADGLERSKWPGNILPAPECGFNTKILLHINLSQSVFQLIHVGSLSAIKRSKSQKTYIYDRDLVINVAVNFQVFGGARPSLSRIMNHFLHCLIWRRCSLISINMRTRCPLS